VNNLRRLFRKYDLQIVFASAITIGLILYSLNQTREFGLNFLTEISGVAITVFLVDRIMKRRERKKTASIDLRILKDLQLISASHFSIWKHLAWKYLPEAQISNEKDLIDLYPQILSNTRISESFEIVSIHHPESWKLFFHGKTIKDCFENYHMAMTEDIQSFLDNFKSYLEPQLLDALFEVLESDYYRSIKSISQSEETEHVIAGFGLDPDKLDSYLDADNVDHIKRMFEILSYSLMLKNKVTEFMHVKYEPYDIKTYFRNPTLVYQTQKE
jgi:hypothetical protein